MNRTLYNQVLENLKCLNYDRAMNPHATPQLDSHSALQFLSDDSTPVLDPVDRVSEIIFGLLMAMTFTGTLSVATAGHETVHTMLLAALGCNLAWGLADAVMYLVRTMTDRARILFMLTQVRNDTDAEASRQLISEVLPRGLARAVGTEGLEFMRQRLLSVPDQAPKVRLGYKDFKTAGGVFLLVVAATFPIVLPFLLFDETGFALRVSNFLGLGMLFLGGCMLAKYAGSAYWKGGLAMLVTGGSLITAIIMLGG